MDNLNRIIFHLKGVWILSYYVAKNPNEEKKPLLDGELCSKLILTKIRRPKGVEQETEPGQSKELAKTRARRKRIIKSTGKKEAWC